MPRYLVTFIETVATTYAVEARDDDAAKETARVEGDPTHETRDVEWVETILSPEFHPGDDA